MQYRDFMGNIQTPTETNSQPPEVKGVECGSKETQSLWWDLESSWRSYVKARVKALAEALVVDGQLAAEVPAYTSPEYQRGWQELWDTFKKSPEMIAEIVLSQDADKRAGAFPDRDDLVGYWHCCRRIQELLRTSDAYSKVRRLQTASPEVSGTESWAAIEAAVSCAIRDFKLKARTPENLLHEARIISELLFEQDRLSVSSQEVLAVIACKCQRL